MPGGTVDICRLDRPVDISVGKCRPCACGTGGSASPTASRHVAAMLVPDPLRRRERRGRPAPGDGRAGNDGGRMMHDRVLHMGGRETRGVSSGSLDGRAARDVSSVLPSCPELVPLLSGLTLVDRAYGPVIRGPRRIGPVEARIAGRSHRPSVSPAVTPDLIRGPACQAPLSPGFPRIGVRGEPGPRIKSGVTRGGGDGPACRHGARPEVKPDSNGLVPGMTAWERTGRCGRQRKGAPNPPAPPLLHSGKYSLKRVPSQAENVP